VSSAEISGRDPATGQPVTVRVDSGRIVDVRREPHASDDLNDPGPYLSPGLIDLQVNGFAGFDVNTTDATTLTHPAEDRQGGEPSVGSADPIVGLVRALFAVGVTTVVPTIVTASEEHIVACLRRVAKAREADPLTRHAIPFVHVEGPHLSDQDGPRGVHPREHIRPPDLAEFLRWQEACDGLVGMVTVSPHFEGSTGYIRELVARGVRVAIGHTHATPEQVRAAADAGATLSTHLGNGAHAVLPRHPNYVWAQLADDRLCAGFIADGHHLPADTLVAMLRAKGLRRSLLVSDATTLAGSPPGVYHTSVGGEVELSPDGRLSYRGTPFLAGAARPVTDGVAHVANLGPFSLAEALELATRSPGRFVGDRGVLEVGAPADLITFTWRPGDTTLTIDRVWVAGQEVVG
jgi:N-acetylglucosamine-6-phosphate deacetylase